MAKEDLEINRSVRRVFVKHWLDLGRLFVRSTNGALTIRGSLMRIAGMADELTPPLVDGMFNEIKRIRNIRRMTIDLDNWQCELGVWKRKEKRASADRQVAHSVGPQTPRHDLDKPRDEEEEKEKA